MLLITGKHKRVCSSRELIVCCVIFLAVSIGVQSKESKNYTVCQSEACIKEDEILRNNLDTTVNPCDNFYDFACGGWMKKHEVPSKNVHVGEASLQKKRITRRLTKIFEAPIEPTDIEPLKKAKRIFQSCMDQETRNSQGLSAIKELVQQLGGWPVALAPKSWNANNNTRWQEINMEILRFSRGSLLGIETYSAPFNSTTNEQTIIIVPSIFLYYSDYVKDPETYRDKTQEYQNFIRNVTIAWTANETWRNSEEFQAAIDEDITEIVRFGTKMAKASQNLTEVSTLTIAELQKLYNDNNNYTWKDTTQIDWLSEIRHVYSSINVTIDSSMKIQVYPLDFIKSLANILGEAPLRTIVNYMMWMIIESSLQYTDGHMMELINNLKPDETPKAELCVEQIKLDTLKEYEYIKIYFPQSSINAVRHYADNIMNDLNDQVRHFTWMDDTTKRNILKKISQMHILIGGPSQNDTEIENFYKDLKLASTYVGNIFNIDSFERHRNIKQFETRYISMTGNLRWQYMPPLTVNAVYLSNINTILLPVGYLGGFQYDKNYLPVTNEALTGWTISHEIVHGILSDYFTYGEPVNHTVWTENTEEAFKSLTECFIEQYDKYSVPEAEVLNKTYYINGTDTLEENIADSGIIMAYHTYRLRKETMNQPEIHLPSFPEYNEDQLFFIAAARAYCESINTQKIDKYLDNPHSSGRARVIGTFSNSEEFATAFNCPRNSPMNPQNKCNIWK